MRRSFSWIAWFTSIERGLDRSGVHTCRTIWSTSRPVSYRSAELLRRFLASTWIFSRDRQHLVHAVVAHDLPHHGLVMSRNVVDSPARTEHRGSALEEVLVGSSPCTGRSTRRRDVQVAVSISDSASVFSFWGELGTYGGRSVMKPNSAFELPLHGHEGHRL